MLRVTSSVVSALTITTGDEAASQDSGSKYCGAQVFDGGAESSACVMSYNFTIILPASANSLYLHEN